MKKTPKCYKCLQEGHYAINCRTTARTIPKTSRKPIKQESYKSKIKRLEVKTLWFSLNPPDKNGFWTCYLQINPQCPVLLDTPELVLEHVRSKARYPHLKFEVTNLKSACRFCNKDKGSLDLEDLVEQFPHLQQYIEPAI